MTDSFHVGILHANRETREFRVWVCRNYPGLSLPQEHSFFAAMLLALYKYDGLSCCNACYKRYPFEDSGTLPHPVTAVKNALGITLEADNNGIDGDDDDDFSVPDNLGFTFGLPADPSPFIEHVEMIRWCGPTDEEDDEHDEEEEDDLSYAMRLQAEYLVRVTDNKYLTTRADPCFLGHYFFDMASHDKGTDNTHIPMGPYQEHLIFPVQDFQIKPEQHEFYHYYAMEQLSNVRQLLDVALPKLLAKDPTTFTQDLFSRLPKDQQEHVLCMLAFARRQDHDLRLLNDPCILFQIVSFLPLHDTRRLTDVREIYLGFKCELLEPLHWPFAYYYEFDLLDYQNQVAMKHFSLCTIVDKLVDICQQSEQHIHTLVNNSVEEHVQEEAAVVYLANLKRIVQAMDNDTSESDNDNDNTNIQFTGLMDARLFSAPPRHPLIWIRERVEAADRCGHMKEFVDHIKNVPPNIN